MKKLNLNSFVKVKLTSKGKDIFYHRYDEINTWSANHGYSLIEPRYPEVDADGYSRFQLLDFMNVYGKYMAMGAPSVVETMNIYVDDEDLKEIQDV